MFHVKHYHDCAKNGLKLLKMTSKWLETPFLGCMIDFGAGRDCSDVFPWRIRMNV